MGTIITIMIMTITTMITITTTITTSMRRANPARRAVTTTAIPR